MSIPISTPHPLETPRLELRRLRFSDAESLYRLLGDLEIHRWTSAIPFPYTIDDAHRFIARHADDQPNDGIVWAMESKGSCDIVGMIGLHDISSPPAKAELGYWVGAEFRGQGLATEAARRVVSWAFEDGGFVRIQAGHFPGNDASARVMRKIGMQGEACLRSYAWKSGQPVDIELYAVLATDRTWKSTAHQFDMDAR